MKNGKPLWFKTEKIFHMILVDVLDSDSSMCSDEDDDKLGGEDYFPHDNDNSDSFSYDLMSLPVVTASLIMLIVIYEY